MNSQVRKRSGSRRCPSWGELAGTQLDELVDTLQALMVVLDRKGRIVKVNPAVLQLLGYTGEQLCGRPVWDLIPEEEQPRIRQVFAELRDRGFPNRAENDWVTARGERRRIAWSNTVIRDEKGRPKWIFGTGIDITEEKKLEMRLRQRERRLRLENALARIFLVEPQPQLWARVVEVVAGELESEAGYFGYVDEQGRLVCPALPESVQARCALRLAPRKIRGLWGPLSQAVSTGKTVVHEGPLSLPPGHIPVSRVMASPVAHQGKILGVLAVANKPQPYSAEDRELLEAVASRLAPILAAHLARSRMEQELREARRAAEEANQAKTRFLAAVSHELRTPLAGILGLLALVEQHPLDEEQRERLRLVRLSAESLLGLVDDLLEAASSEVQGVRLRPVLFRLRELLDGVRQLLELRAAEKSLPVRLWVDPELPDEFYGDPDRLRQVLLNLGHNAIKFTTEGYVEIRASGQLEPAGEFLFRFEVIDTGIGISPQAQARLFQYFSQAAPELSARYGGKGLGLAICKQLVESMGGEIGVESEPGRGSRFWFTVRLKQARREAAGEGSLHTLDKPERPLKILLVDDNPVNQRVGQGLLERRGHQVTVARHGREAVEVLSRDRYDVVLMDVRMPEMDGLEAAREIRDPGSPVLQHDVPIIALTADVGAEDQRLCLEAGMNDYLPKPFRPEELYSKVESWGQKTALATVATPVQETQDGLPVQDSPSQDCPL